MGTKPEKVKPVPNLTRVTLWNTLVDEVFNHDKSKYSLFVYELLKRRILGRGLKQYRATEKSDKHWGVKNIS